jgi:hypothetical protein
MHSRLYYHGSDIDVQLGDVVSIKRFLRRPVRGVVCYIPGICARHSELEYGDVQQWAIRRDNGCVYPIIYAPEQIQPDSDIVFVARGITGAVTPDEPLE